jgi:hypothetical protein
MFAIPIYCSKVTFDVARNFYEDASILLQVCSPNISIFANSSFICVDICASFAFDNSGRGNSKNGKKISSSNS